MTSSEKNGSAAAAAADQLGSMSLGEKSVERKCESNEDAKENDEAPAKFCSACGEKSDTLMKCRACKCVWYCGTDCQNKHWKEHKKQCKLIKKELGKRGGKLDVGTELDIGPLPDLPQREECPICMQVLPIHTRLQTYASCCSKTFCRSCDFQHKIKNKGRSLICAFCRTAVPKSEAEYLANLRKGVERKDPDAVFDMALNYGKGELGLPVNQAKCIELLRQSADLGCPVAQFQLGVFHDDGVMGLEENKEEANKYWKKAAEGGDLDARHNLGAKAAGHGDFVAAMRHWRLAASGGFRRSMGDLIWCFEDGLLHHGDLSKSLQAFYRSRGEMESGDRDQHTKHLKRTGQYQDDMDS